MATSPYPMYGNPNAFPPPPLNLDPNGDIHNMFYNDQGVIQANANQMQNEAQGQLGYYGPLQQQSQQQEAAALAQLQQTPGFTPGEASQINVNYGANKTSGADLNKQFLTPGEQQGIAGDPNAPKDTMTSGTAAEGAQLNAYGSNLGGQVSNLDKGVGGQYASYGANLGGANQNLEGWLQGAQGKFSSLDAAVNNPGLAFDPNKTEKQLTDQDVQNMKTAAGTTVGNMYRSSEDQLRREAAAAGTTDPLALAAAQSRMNAQSAAGMGDAEVSADIAAKQAQYGRASGIEGQREGAVRAQTGFLAGAATTEQAQAQNAAALAGTTDVASANAIGQAGISAAEMTGQAGINAANTYGQTAVNQATNAANQNYGAAATAEQSAAQRAALLGTDRQATQTGVNNTQYGQGVQTQGLTASGAQTVGAARQAGQGAYRAGVAQQQGLAQQGGQTAIDQQGRAAATEAQGLNSSTASRAGYENSGPGGLGKMGGQIFGSLVGSGTSLGNTALGGEKGAIVTKPTKMMLGEGGKAEMVIPLMPQYGAGRKRQEA